MAQVQVPILRCSLVEEHYTSQGALVKRGKVEQVDLALSRNEFREITLDICSLGKVPKKRSLLLKYEVLKLYRKFVKEGKLSMEFPETHTKLLLSNCPPMELVVWVKALAAKLAATREVEPRLSTRAKLLSERGPASEGISPVTARDVSHMKRAEAGGRGLLKARGYTPKAESPLLRKRKRCVEGKENSGESPVLSGSSQGTSRRLLGEGEGQPTPKRSCGDLLARSTPTRKSGLAARRPLRVQPGPILTREQKYVLESVRSGRNVFFTGGAGTGKSFLVHKIIGVLPPDHTFVTASTGVAAYQIGGTTLHSFAGIGTGEALISKCIELAQRKTVLQQWRRCRHLVVDEVSMVDGEYFKKLEAVAQAVKGNDRPFGGIQLILTGDFLQLPPVTKGNQKRRFAFETSAWGRCNLMNLKLTVVKRQTDMKMVGLLNRLREGRCEEEDVRVLRETRSHVAGEGIVATRLCTHTDDVATINRRELERCEGEERRFTASDSEPSMARFLDSHTPVEQVLKLRVGAQVMLMKNLEVGRGLVNGARGRVEAFTKEGNPMVVFMGGTRQEVRLEKWMVKTGLGSVVTRSQIPLGLAWAFSIHKSQGMTLDCVEVSLARVFECGQAYVALSRARSLASLKVLDFKPGCVKADQKVLQFYRQLQVAKPMVQPRLEEMAGVESLDPM